MSDILTLNNLVRNRNSGPCLLKINDNTAAASAALFLEEMSVFKGRNLIVVGVLCSRLMVWMIVSVVVSSHVRLSFSSLSSFDLDNV